MKTYTYKIKKNKAAFAKIEEVFKTCDFIHNKCLRYWMDNKDTDTNANLYAFHKYIGRLRGTNLYPWLNRLYSQACQMACEPAWFAISNFYRKCKKGLPGKKGYPKWKHGTRSYEYSQTGYKYDQESRSLTITDNTEVGKLRLYGNEFPANGTKFQRVRIVKEADGYYVQIITKEVRTEQAPITNNVIALDVGLKEYYTDSNGGVEPNPRFYRKAEKNLKNLHKKLSRKKKGSNNRKKAKQVLARAYLKVRRKRKDHAIKLARKLFLENDVVIIEKLTVANMVRNKRLSKSIQDAGWSQFFGWLDTYSTIFGKTLIKVNPKNTSQTCSNCGKKAKVKLTLADRVFECNKCGSRLDRDVNAAINLLDKGLTLLSKGVGTTSVSK